MAKIPSYPSSTFPFLILFLHYLTPQVEYLKFIKQEHTPPIPSSHKALSGTYTTHPFLPQSSLSLSHIVSLAMARCFSYAQLSSILVFLMVGFARSDFASDRNECATQLVGLTTCLPYVQGESKTPTPDCCSGLKQVIAKSRKCICILVKDRDNPSLGFKINATLALKLPGACSTPMNASECIDLLHLAPNSSDAQIFKQFQGTNTTTNGAKGSPSASSTSSGSGSGTVVMSTGAAADKGGKRWVVRDMVVGVWTWCLICLVIMGA